mgnify:CR=1 FL=1
MKCMERLTNVVEKIESALKSTMPYPLQSSAGSDTNASFLTNSQAMGANTGRVPRMKGKNTGKERRSSYTNVIKEFNEIIERMKAAGSADAENLVPLTEDYVRDAQTLMRTEIDTRLPGIRGACACEERFRNMALSFSESWIWLRVDFHFWLKQH